jgi:hypothetical protein
MAGPKSAAHLANCTADSSVSFGSRWKPTKRSWTAFANSFITGRRIVPAATPASIIAFFVNSNCRLKLFCWNAIAFSMSAPRSRMRRYAPIARSRGDRSAEVRR